MRIIDVQQGSPEWVEARLGIPTASEFHRILTPSGARSAASDGYLAQLAAEWFLWEPLEDYRSAYMARGTEMEQLAIPAYEWERQLRTIPVGLCLRDDGLSGASPDRLVGDEGQAEFKGPGAATHFAYLLSGAEKKKYRCQVQGQLWVTGRRWNDLFIFNPAMPCILDRIERDEKFIALLAESIGEFTDRLAAVKERYAAERAAYQERRAAEAAEFDRPGDPEPIDPDPFATADTGARPDFSYPEQ